MKISVFLWLIRTMQSYFMKWLIAIPQDLNIIWGSYKFILQATVDHNGNVMHRGHYTSSVNCNGKTIYFKDDLYIECNNVNTHNSSTVCMYYYIHWSCHVLDQTVEGRSLLTSMMSSHVSFPLITGRGIHQTCGIGNVFPPYDLWMCLDTHTIYW